MAASDDPARFGPQDYVFCTLKSHKAHAAASSFIPLLGSQTAVVTAMNGIPWWYFYKECGEFEGRQLETVDPQGRQWKSGEIPGDTPLDNAAFLLCVVQGLNVLAKTKPSRQKMELIVSNAVSSPGAQTGLHSPAN